MKTNTKSSKEKKQTINLPPPPPEGQTSFFYSTTKQINAIDDYLFFDNVVVRYPQLQSDGTAGDEAEVKKAIVKFLSDEDFVDELLLKFRLSQFDFFKLVCERWGLLFRGMFLNKIKRLVLQRSYMGVD